MNTEHLRSMTMYTALNQCGTVYVNRLLHTTLFTVVIESMVEHGRDVMPRETVLMSYSDDSFLCYILIHHGNKIYNNTI